MKSVDTHQEIARGTPKKSMRNSLKLLGGPLGKSVDAHQEIARGTPRKSMRNSMKLLGGPLGKVSTPIKKLLGDPKTLMKLMTRAFFVEWPQRP